MKKITHILVCMVVAVNCSYAQTVASSSVPSSTPSKKHTNEMFLVSQKNVTFDTSQVQSHFGIKPPFIGTEYQYANNVGTTKCFILSPRATQGEALYYFDNTTNKYKLREIRGTGTVSFGVPRVRTEGLQCVFFHE